MEAVKTNVILALTGHIFICGMAAIVLLAVFLVTSQVSELAIINQAHIII